jgi:hypothetical protein
MTSIIFMYHERLSVALPASIEGNKLKRVPTLRSTEAPEGEVR